MSDNRIINADDLVLPDDIIVYINDEIKKYWTGVSASWVFSPSTNRSFNRKNYDRLKEAEPIIKREFGERGWNVEMEFSSITNKVNFKVTKKEKEENNTRRWRRRSSI
jgi:hypothetical protein